MLHTELWCRAPNKLRSHDSLPGAHADCTKPVNGLPPGSAKVFLRQMARRCIERNSVAISFEMVASARKARKPGNCTCLEAFTYKRNAIRRPAFHSDTNKECCTQSILM